jgi:hypothetical protein
VVGVGFAAHGVTDVQDGVDDGGGQEAGVLLLGGAGVVVGVAELVERDVLVGPHWSNSTISASTGPGSSRRARSIRVCAISSHCFGVS